LSAGSDMQTTMSVLCWWLIRNRPCSRRWSPTYSIERKRFLDMDTDIQICGTIQ